MTKFISKNANLRIVLKQAMPAEPMTGRLAVPGLYIKFENGIVNVNSEEHVKMMLAHSGFDRDYVVVEENQTDPYKDTRRENEPDHQITEMKYGHAENIQGSSHNVRLDPRLKNAAQKMAIEMAKEIAPQLAKDMLLEMAKQKMAAKAQKENTRGAAHPEESMPAEDLSAPVNEEFTTPEDCGIVLDADKDQSNVSEDVKTLETNESSQSGLDELEGVDVGKTSESEKTGMEDASSSTNGPLEFKCSCGKTAKTKAGLMAHQRNCEKFKNEIEIK